MDSTSSLLYKSMTLGILERVYLIPEPNMCLYVEQKLLRFSPDMGQFDQNNCF